MSTSTSTPHAPPADPLDLKAEAGRDSAAVTGHVPSDPSIPAPGATEKGERICDAPSDPDKPAGVESVDKGA